MGSKLIISDEEATIQETVLYLILLKIINDFDNYNGYYRSKIRYHGRTLSDCFSEWIRARALLIYHYFYVAYNYFAVSFIACIYNIYFINLPEQPINHSSDSDRNTDPQQESPCLRKWEKGEQHYYCITCSRSNVLAICAECFRHSEHSRHDYQLIVSEFYGSCGCGDYRAMKRKSYCTLHANCNRNSSEQKASYNDSEQFIKISQLLSVTPDVAKHLAQLNNFEIVGQLDGKIISHYFNKSRVHPNMNIELISLYAVYRKIRERKFRQKFSNETRMLLWHGTERANLKGIFETGSLELMHTNIGDGIYFADRVTESANYTDCGLYEGFRESTGVLLLCEVAVGNMYEVKYPQRHLTQPPNNYQSIKGLGRYQPSSSCAYTKKNIIAPLGATTQSMCADIILLCNEYIVYEPSRVLIKFFAEFERK